VRHKSLRPQPPSLPLRRGSPNRAPSPAPLQHTPPMVHPARCMRPLSIPSPAWGPCASLSAIHCDCLHLPSQISRFRCMCGKRERVQDQRHIKTRVPVHNTRLVPPMSSDMRAEPTSRSPRRVECCTGTRQAAGVGCRGLDASVHTIRPQACCPSHAHAPCDPRSAIQPHDTGLVAPALPMCFM
jgi:hypothetical protein